MAMAQNSTVPVNVGVVLDINTTVGTIWLSCISMALSDFYASHGSYKTRLVLNTRDSKRDVVGAAAAALGLMKNVEVQGIIGPTTSMQADFVIDLGGKAQVPIISFSATSPSLSSLRSPYFIRATQIDSSQVGAISAIVKAFGWREVVPVYVDNEFGEGIIPFLTDALEEIDVRVPYRSIIPPSATDDQLVVELYKLMTMQTRVFIVHMLPSLGSRLFTKAKEIGMMSEDYVWIITDAMANELSSMDQSVINSMQGILGVKSNVLRTKELENFTVRWKRKFLQANPTLVNAELNIFGLRAYDATTALAIAVEKVGAKSFAFQKANISGKSTDLETFGVSQNGPMLLQALQNTTFRGLSGDFYLVDGQLQSSPYQIVNVIGNGGRGIGFWTPKNGIIRELNFTNSNTDFRSKSNLGSIIWPGDTTSPPKGWVIPTNGKKLRVGVPVKDGFSQFVTVTRNPGSNKTTVTGYCIDVFEAVITALPYAVPHEYIPFATPDGNSAEEKVVSNLARFVLIIWVFVVLILTQSYTASLTSMLTVQQLQPMVTDVKELIKKGEYVGYLEGSFVLGLLRRMNFDENKLKVYNSPEECDELFSKGSGNGGIAAAFDEIPYIKIFLAQYCSKYAMVQPTYKTDGFGFVFPIGSPLVPDVSRAVLNVTEGDKMEAIEKEWFGQQSTCSDSGPSLTSNSLGLNSFWGLFLISGIASVSALIIFTGMFIREHWHVIKCFDPHTSIWTKIVMLARRFDQKDLKSHTFKTSELRDRSGMDGINRMSAIDASPQVNCPTSPSTFTLRASPNTNEPPSPSRFSPHTERNFSIFKEQETPPHEFGDKNPPQQTTQEIIPAIDLTSQDQYVPRTVNSASENH
ncbi:unnamed protein product [Ilex paraguariensis]|uniref:Glutamate receptor n=1 Tax=Ilex paraguariensis TaxID=185542 RepID=A0ABC8TZ08_9AQUA